MIGYVTLGHLLFVGDDAKRWSRVTKPIMIGKTPCRLYSFEFVANSYLATVRTKFLAPADIRALSCWLFLDLYFFTPQVFLFSIRITTFCQQWYHICMTNTLSRLQKNFLKQILVIHIRIHVHG